MPAHTTQLLQPLDVGVFGAFKAKYRSMTASACRDRPYYTLKKDMFPQMYKACQTLVVSPTLIKDSFAKTGIYPFNPEAIDKKKLIPSRKRSTLAKECLLVCIALFCMALLAHVD